MDRRSLIAGTVGALAFASIARAQPAPDGPDTTPIPVPDRQRARGPDPDEDVAPDAGASAHTEPAAASEPPAEGPPTPGFRPDYPARSEADTYSRGEMVNGVSDFLGVSAESAAAAIQKIFKENGRPTAYIAGEEGSAAFIGGVRYGKGLLYMKNRQPVTVYWRGPTVGFDWGGNASRSFTLCYDLQYPDMIFRRFPGVEGTAYLIGGLGVNYQKADGVTLAPIRAGVGLRLGANVGYLAYSRSKNYFPF